MARTPRKISEKSASECPPPSLDDAVLNLAQERVAHLVKDAARAFIRSMQIRLAPHGVSYGHWTILRVLWQQDALSQRDLAERAGVTEPTTFTAVKSLEGLGYVERTHLPGDNKKVHVFLTKRGKALRRKLVPLAEQVNDISLQGITPEEIAATRKVLIAIELNLASDEQIFVMQGKRMPSTQELGRMTSGMN